MPDLLPLFGLIGSLAGNLFQFLQNRRKREAEAAKVNADAGKATAEAAEILIRSLTDQYRAAVQEQERMRSEVEAMRHEIERLRDEVADMTDRFEEIVRIVRGLPEEIQQRFDEALKPRRRPSTRKHE